MSVFKVFVFIQIFAFVLMVIGILGQKFQFLPFRVAFLGFLLALLLSAIVFLVAALLSLMSLGDVSAASLPRVGLTVAALLPVLLAVIISGKGLKAPRIHDISTDLDKNIEFTKAFELRKDSENSILLPEDKTVELQKLNYPDLKPLLVEMSPAAAFDNAIAIAEQLGWKITMKEQSRGVFEAVDETAIFGFRDDIVVRVGPYNSGTRIDLRSVSRVGVSDLGANAARIEKFQAAFKGSL